MVAKKDGTLRPVIDYRKLNKITKPDPFPMPRIEDLIDDLASATYITTLDLTKGYWQVPVEETSRDKTAFVTPFGKYEFTVMPFGLMGAPATFQRMMNDIFGDASDHVAAYIYIYCFCCSSSSSSTSSSLPLSPSTCSSTTLLTNIWRPHRSQRAADSHQ